MEILVLKERCSLAPPLMRLYQTPGLPGDRGMADPRLSPVNRSLSRSARNSVDQAIIAILRRALSAAGFAQFVPIHHDG